MRFLWKPPFKPVLSTLKQLQTVERLQSAARTQTCCCFKIKRNRETDLCFFEVCFVFVLGANLNGKQLSKLLRTRSTLWCFFSRIDYIDYSNWIELLLIFQSGTNIFGFVKVTKNTITLEVCGNRTNKNIAKLPDWGSGRPATPVFSKVKLLLLSRESGGSGEHR